MAEKDPNDFAAYAGYLSTHIWPSVHPRTGEVTHTEITYDSMAPQHAASSLAKLVRWARIAPEGDVALLPDEDSREYEVRASPLGKALAARACNLDVELFFGIYGEFGAGEEADYREVVAELAVSLGDHDLDWTLQERIKLGINLQEDLAKSYRIVKRFS